MMTSTIERPVHAVQTLAVGFADLCGFTPLSRSLPERELVTIIERFEGAALLALPAAGATLVKLLGDGVLFHAEDVATAVDAAASLVHEARAGGGVPDVRAAITYGRVVVRAGDCFGESVNRANRLLDVGPPGTVVADDAAAARLRAVVRVGRGRLTAPAAGPRRASTAGWMTDSAITRRS